MKKNAWVLFVVVLTACGRPPEEECVDCFGPLPDAICDVSADEGQPDTTEPDMGQPDEGQPDEGQPDLSADEAGVCVPSCEDRNCGDNGCGGSCGECGDTECLQGACVSGQCRWSMTECLADDPTMVGVCDTGDGTCRYEPKTCTDKPCMEWELDEEGSCLWTSISCDDGDLCTTDSCNPATGECESVPVVCDDGLSYTDDSCNPETGACEFVTRPGTCFRAEDCADGNACTEDVCDQATNQCRWVEVICDSGSPCATAKCFNPPIGVLGYLCEVVEYKDCDDGNACTWDWCDWQTGECNHSPNVCDDGSACTIDYCDPEMGCIQEPIFCDDGNRCTTDFCDHYWGCVSTWLKGRCNSNEDCASGDMCWNGTCEPSPICTVDSDCDDGDKFTWNWCDKSEKAWKCQFQEKMFSFTCNIPVAMAGDGRYCEAWALWGGLDEIGNKTDFHATGNGGVFVPARAVCSSWWRNPTMVETTARVYGPGMEHGPWIGGGYGNMYDPQGNQVSLAEVEHPWADPNNWGTTQGIPWCN